jgi:fibronectin-binding autotransporter adhesin
MPPTLVSRLRPFVPPFLTAVLLAAPAARAQTWTGLAAPDNHWTTVGNWDTGVPGGSSTATFNSAGNGNTTISLGGATQPIKFIDFDTASAAAYTLGVFGSGDAFNLTANGSIVVTNTVTNPQVINAAITTGGASFITNAGSGALTLAGAVALGGNISFLNDTSGAGTNVALTGPIAFSSAGNRTITTNLPSGKTLSLGSAVAPSTITLGSGSQLIVNAINLNAGATVINDVISGAGSLSITSPNPVTLAGLNTYSGGTTISGHSGLGGGAMVLVGSSSNGPPGSFTGGPFGTGPVTINVTNPPSTDTTTIQPIAQPQTIANAITAVANVTFAGTPVTLTGTFTVSPLPSNPAALVLTNNGGFLTTLTLSGNIFLSSSATTGHTLSIGGNGSTLISGTIADFNGAGSPGRLMVTGPTLSGVAPTVDLTNANTYSGGTFVVNGGHLLADNTAGSATGSGPVSVTGSGLVGNGGTLGGSGAVAGVITISSTTASFQGGVISPGGGSRIPGTLNVGPMIWDPRGEYAVDYNPADNTTGGGVNDFVSGTGSLDLSNLNSANAFTLSFTKVPATGTLATPETYTIATMAGGINGAGGVPGAPFADGSDVSGLFVLPSQNMSAVAMIVGTSGGPQSLEVTLTPVPEPGSLLLVAAAGGFAYWRRRRRG